MTGARPLELWLKQPARLYVLGAVAVVLLAAYGAVSLRDVFDAREREISFAALLAFQLSSWSFWWFAAGPIVLAFDWLRRHLGSWLLALLFELPLSFGVAHVSLSFNAWLGPQMLEAAGREGPGRGGFRDPLEREARREERMREEFPPRRGPFGPPAPGPRGPGDGRALPQVIRSFRFGRELVTYWALLGAWFCVIAFRETSEQRRRAAEAELHSERLRTELERARIGSLEAQLQPHFLFNALHAVGGLIRSREEQKALRTLSALGDLLRRTLEGGSRNLVRLEEELSIAERYLDIERIRLGDRLVAEVSVAPETRSLPVPFLCLLPLVENAVKHAVAPRESGGTIGIRAERRGDELLLEVVDDGPGFPAGVLRDPASRRNGADREHIGLANCRDRLRLLYGTAARFELENPERGGGRVRLSIPIGARASDA